MGGAHETYFFNKTLNSLFDLAVMVVEKYPKFVHVVLQKRHGKRSGVLRENMIEVFAK